MLLIKCSLKRLIKLGSNDFTVLFTDQIRINCLYRNTHPSTCFKTHFRAFQILGRAFHTRVQAFKTLGRAFEVLRENHNKAHAVPINHGRSCSQTMTFEIKCKVEPKVRISSVNN